MRIAFISLEYPPDTAYGGIGTYTGQVVALLHKRGHDVEVFTASPSREGSFIVNDIPVHYILDKGLEYFRENIVTIFATRHEQAPFDIIESPEYNADGLGIKEKYPNLPLAVKLHTPKFLVDKLNGNEPSATAWVKMRILLGAYRRLQKPSRFWIYDKNSDPEYRIAKKADLISSPSLSLRNIVAEKWEIPEKNIIHLPYPFMPLPGLLDIPVRNKSKTITYLGRLEVRKGVCIFTKVIPAIIEKLPDYTFHFVGSDLPSPEPGLSMKAFLAKTLIKYQSNIRFTGRVSQSELPRILSDTAICVFPSIWENFPNVCLEAMSAGRAIVGSKNGGMKDMLEFPQAGILVDPYSAEEIIAALEKYITNPELRFRMGEQARRNVLENYNETIIGEKIETIYGEVISRSEKKLTNFEEA